MSLPIDAAIQNHPGELAFTNGVVQLTYADLVDELGDKTVASIASLDKGTHVAWPPKNDSQDFLTFWSLLRQGAVVCPISHRLPADQRSDLLKRIDAVWLPEWQAETTLQNQKFEDAIRFDAESPATLILSSGSTGVPKAVVHAMSAHIANAEGAASNMPLAPGDRWLWSLPLFHISGLAILIRCAVAGATVVSLPGAERLSAAWLNDLQITHLSVVSTQLRRLLADNRFPSPFLKKVLLGGSNIDPQLVRSARQRGVEVFTTYGLTEMASQVTASARNGAPNASGSILPGRQLRISSAGEILVRGDTLCLGYYRHGKIQPIVDGAGWFHTKDLGRITEERELVVNGRLDNMFISGGENIYPEHIERTMMRAFEIDQVIVVPKPDETYGMRPVAFVRGGLPKDWNQILRESLKGYEVPVQILAWPSGLVASVKLQRAELKARVETLEK